MYYPEVPVLLSFLLTCSVNSFCWLMSKTDCAWRIKIESPTIMPPSPLLWEEHNVTKQVVKKLHPEVSFNKHPMQCWSQMNEGRWILLKRTTWFWQMLVGRLFLCFLSVEPLWREINFSPSLFNPSPLIRGRRKHFFFLEVFNFPYFGLCVPALALTSRLLFLDSLLRNTELIKGLLSTSWYLFSFSFAFVIRNVLPSVCSC